MLGRPWVAQESMFLISLRISRWKRQERVSANATAGPSARLLRWHGPSFAWATLSGARKHASYFVANTTMEKTRKGFCKCHGRPFCAITTMAQSRKGFCKCHGRPFACLDDPGWRKKACFSFRCEYHGGRDKKGFLQMPRQALLRDYYDGTAKEGFLQMPRQALRLFPRSPGNSPRLSAEQNSVASNFVFPSHLSVAAGRATLFALRACPARLPIPARPTWRSQPTFETCRSELSNTSALSARCAPRAVLWPRQVGSGLSHAILRPSRQS